jgi:hypothetical protein
MLDPAPGTGSGSMSFPQPSSPVPADQLLCCPVGGGRPRASRVICGHACNQLSNATCPGCCFRPCASLAGRCGGNTAAPSRYRHDRRSSSVPARPRLQICFELVVDGAAGVRSPKSSPAASEILLAEGKAYGGWQEVLRRHSARPPSPAALPPPSIPAWLFGRCCRCLAHGHRAALCRDPLQCSRCLENGHCACECRNPWRPLSSVACLVAPPCLASVSTLVLLQLHVWVW